MTPPHTNLSHELCFCTAPVQWPAAEIRSRIRMSRAGSSGGGRSSLGYLFEPEEEVFRPIRTIIKPKEETEKATTENHSSDVHQEDKVMAVDEEAGQEMYLPPPPKRGDHSNPIVSLRPAASIIYHTNQSGSNSGLLITDRPSTRVRCAPGGPSSLGFLFGDERN